MEFDHPLHIQWPAASTGAVPSEVRFDCGYGNSPTWATMPAGTTRRYRLTFRINDRTNTNVGTAADAPQEWLWTLRGYQQYFRALYGRPDYRRMGGWDGRVIGSFNSSPNGTYNATTNPRTFGTNALDNPSTVGTGGAPDGYCKFRNRALAFKARNVHRVIAWAFAGYEAPGVVSYDPRIATGVGTMPVDIGTSVGPDTVRPAVRQSRDAVQFGLWWGESCKVPESDTWSDGSRHGFDPTNAGDRSRMFAELDVAVQIWHAQLIGLDAYGLASTNPGRSVEWLRALQQRYPRLLFITEENLPDFLHVVAPTYRDEGTFEAVQSAAWIVQYVNPGAEYLMQTVSGEDQPDTVDRFCRLGYTAIGGWSDPLGGSALLARALHRWREIGERAIPGFDTGRTRDIASAMTARTP